MTHPLDAVVPPDLRAVLAEDDVAVHEGFTLQLLTVREDGFPHAAMLSVGEMVALDERRLRIAVWPRSTSAANLAVRPAATIATVIAPTSYLLRVAVARLGSVETPLSGRLAAFEAVVEAVAADEAPYAVLEDGIRYRLTDREPTLARWAETRQALREAL